ncbi:MAG: hypothetical protein IIB45_07185 [Candidatus Marinimicrobia bacterium]|nr:hypothetical protein [Candidatus Neomarinimicrobiota bacterium]
MNKYILLMKPFKGFTLNEPFKGFPPKNRRAGKPLKGLKRTTGAAYPTRGVVNAE